MNLLHKSRNQVQSKLAITLLSNRLWDLDPMDVRYGDTENIIPFFLHLKKLMHTHLPNRCLCAHEKKIDIRQGWATIFVRGQHCALIYVPQAKLQSTRLIQS